jgi:hypothetical protein
MSVQLATEVTHLSISGQSKARDLAKLTEVGSHLVFVKPTRDATKIDGRATGFALQRENFSTVGEVTLEPLRCPMPSAAFAWSIHPPQAAAQRR